MKIAVVEDDSTNLRNLVAAIRAAGHEALGVFLAPRRQHNLFSANSGVVVTDRLSVAVAAITKFTPDFVFLDHSLNIEPTNGKTVAEALDRFKIGPERCVGTSSSYQKVQRAYCRRLFGYKQLWRHPDMPDRLRELLEELAGEYPAQLDPP